MSQFRGQIVSFSPTTYRATVRLEASAAQTLAGIQVNRLAAASILPGRKCLIDTGDHADIEDAVIIAIWAEAPED